MKFSPEICLLLPRTWGEVKVIECQGSVDPTGIQTQPPSSRDNRQFWFTLTLTEGVFVLHLCCVNQGRSLPTMGQPLGVTCAHGTPTRPPNTQLSAAGSPKARNSLN